VTAYNRTGSVYIPLLIRGLTVSLAPSGVAALTAVSAGNVTIVSPSSGVALTVNGNTTNNTLTLANAAGQPAFIGFNGNASVQGFIGTAGAANNLVTGSSVGDLVIRSQGGTVRVSANSGTSTQLAVTSTTVGILGAAGSAQVTGWGTPTGPAVVANFSGTAATLVQCSNAIAKIITDLKSLGLYGA
jgi:hypothetical protein